MSPSELKNALEQFRLTLQPLAELHQTFDLYRVSGDDKNSPSLCSEQFLTPA